MFIRKILLLLFLVPVVMPLTAQVKFSTVVSTTQMGKNDYVQVEYVVENAKSVEQITAPVFNGFNIVSGPMQQEGMSVINGVMTRSKGLTFILRPTTTGKLIIPGASAMVDGKTMRSNNVTVVVSNKASATPPPQSFSPFALPDIQPEPDVDEDYILHPGESAQEKIKHNLMVKLDVSKTSCYEGEPIVATYKLYSRLKSESRVTKRPSLNGFSVYDMVEPDINSPSIEKLNGKLFNVHVIRKVQLYPLQVGSFDLDPVELDNVVHFVRVDGNSGGGSMFLGDDIMGKPEDQQVTLATKPVTITVKPLPAAGKPASFDGAVGKFTISASMSQVTVPANETARLLVELKGDGNIPLINAPTVNWPQQIEAFDPAVKETSNKTVAPIHGVKQFEYSFTAKEIGKVTIPAVEFSYFDPAANSYKTIATKSFELVVTPATHTGARKPGAEVKKEMVQTSSRWKSLLWLLPVLAIIALAMWYRRKNNTPAAPPQPAGNKNSSPVAITADAPIADPFNAARKAFNSGSSQLFYKETGNTIWKALSEKLAITASQLNKPAVINHLQQKGADPETIQQLEAVLRECELALYTPVHSETDMIATLNKAEIVLLHLNNLK